MKKLMLFLIIIAASCAPEPEMISEKEVINTVEGFFEALNVDNDNPALLDEYITQDFMIYEAGKKMNKKEFLEFVSGFPILKTKWTISDVRVSADVNSAHVSLFNTGDFLLQIDSTQIQQEFKWLESAYLIMEEGKLKIRFYFSDNIAMKADTVR